MAEKDLVSKETRIDLNISDLLMMNDFFLDYLGEGHGLERERVAEFLIKLKDIRDFLTAINKEFKD